MIDHGDLHAGDARPMQRVAHIVVPVAGRGMHRVRAEGPRPEQGHADRRAAGFVERGPPQRQLPEGRLDPGPRGDLEVLDHAAAPIVRDGVEAHRHDTPVAEQLVARGPRDVVQHRDERRPGTQLAEVRVRRTAKDEHDVLCEDLVALGEPHVALRGVRVGREAQALAVAGLEHDLVGAETGERPDEPRQEVPAFAGVFGHPQEPDGSSHLRRPAAPARRRVHGSIVPSRRSPRGSPRARPPRRMHGGRRRSPGRRP